MKIVKITALILSFVMVFALLCACGETPNNPKPTPSGAGEGSDGPEQTGYNFNDEEFVFLASFIPRLWRDYSEDEKASVGYREPIYNVRQQAMVDKLLATEEKLHCRIVNMPIFAGTVAEMAAMISTGDVPVDFMYSTSLDLRDFYIGGLVADLRDIEAIDLTDAEKWGNENLLKLTQYKGAQYAVPQIGSAYYPFESNFYGILLRKNTAFNEFNLDWTAEEMIENGDWTFDKFLDDVMPEVYSDYDDGFTKRYSFGYGGGAYVYLAALFVNEGSTVIYNEDSGKYEYGLLTENATEAIDFCRELWQRPEQFNTNSASVDLFLQNEYTFMLTVGYRTFKEIAAGTTDITWLPFPYGPHSIYGESVAAYSNQNCDCVTGIFVGGVNDADPDAETQKNGIVFNELFSPTEFFGRDGFDDWMAHNMFPDDNGESWGVYDQMRKNVHLSYRDEIGGELYNTICARIQQLLNSPNRSITDTMSKIKDAVDSQLDLELNN